MRNTQRVADAFRRYSARIRAAVSAGPRSAKTQAKKLARRWTALVRASRRAHRLPSGPQARLATPLPWEAIEIASLMADWISQRQCRCSFRFVDHETGEPATWTATLPASAVRAGLDSKWAGREARLPLREGTTIAVGQRWPMTIRPDRIDPETGRPVEGSAVAIEPMRVEQTLDRREGFWPRFVNRVPRDPHLIGRFTEAEWTETERWLNVHVYGTKAKAKTRKAKAKAKRDPVARRRENHGDAQHAVEDDLGRLVDWTPRIVAIPARAILERAESLAIADNAPTAVLTLIRAGLSGSDDAKKASAAASPAAIEAARDYWSIAHRILRREQ